MIEATLRIGDDGRARAVVDRCRAPCPWCGRACARRGGTAGGWRPGPGGGWAAAADPEGRHDVVAGCPYPRGICCEGADRSGKTATRIRVNDPAGRYAQRGHPVVRDAGRHNGIVTGSDGPTGRTAIVDILVENDA